MTATKEAPAKPASKPEDKPEAKRTYTRTEIPEGLDFGRLEPVKAEKPIEFARKSALDGTPVREWVASAYVSKETKQVGPLPHDHAEALAKLISLAARERKLRARTRVERRGDVSVLHYAVLDKRAYTPKPKSEDDGKSGKK